MAFAKGSQKKPNKSCMGSELENIYEIGQAGREREMRRKTHQGIL